MRNIWTIAPRELRLYFASPVAYIVGLLISADFWHLFCTGNLSVRPICLYLQDQQQHLVPIWWSG